MIEEKIKWNRKYQTPLRQNATVLLKHIPRAASGQKALDLAGGLGHNASELLKMGYGVTLIDISDIALSKIKNRNIEKICLDLDNYIIPQNRFDVIVMTKYLNTEILKQIPEALKNNGFFIFETVKKYPVEKTWFFEIFKNFKTIYFTQEPFRFVGQKLDKIPKKGFK